LAKTKTIHKRQTHLIVRKDVHKDYDGKGPVEKKTPAISVKGLGAKMN
jgi:hypothetical protein